MTRHDLDGVRQMRRAPGLLDAVFEAVLVELAESRRVVGAFALMADPTSEAPCPFCDTSHRSKHAPSCAVSIALAITEDAS